MNVAAGIELPEVAIANVCRLHQVKELSLFAEREPGEVYFTGAHSGAARLPLCKCPGERPKDRQTIRRRCRVPTSFRQQDDQSDLADGILRRHLSVEPVLLVDFAS